MEESIKIFKIGGSVIEQPELLRSFLKDFAALPHPKILVHGGGRSATTMAEKMGIPTRMVEGRRVTDEAMLEIVLMVYGGLNKKITALLQAEQCNAIGLTGADMNAIRAHKRPANPVDYGLVGDIVAVNSPGIISLLEQGIVPVMAPLTHDGQGQILNTNADHIAGSIAKGLAEHSTVELYYCFEKKGVMLDPEDNSSLISSITLNDFMKLKAEGVVAEGMIPKLENAFKTLDAGVEKVCIMHYQGLKHVGSKQFEGTTLCLR
ncbi:acetylglutamate kinase [Catalinimonas niigatensis]|uniref:acetylglutamate kinase n=1 Tax=Catalinimonas niigatensis TaxID=1397264 RepID=UPI00266603BD|nr:acetylglutamate kinase [Catalinimonas niigatensis]WPP51248.1 acetylglutamate kinase [Catalinimonas niigatensis]